MYFSLLNWCVLVVLQHLQLCEMSLNVVLVILILLYRATVNVLTLYLIVSANINTHQYKCIIYGQAKLVSYNHPIGDGPSLTITLPSLYILY